MGIKSLHKNFMHRLGWWASLMLIASSAAAQSVPEEKYCESLLESLHARPVAAPEGYSLRMTPGSAPRCEGYFKPQTSGSMVRLRVVSFTVGKLIYELKKELILSVQLDAAVQVTVPEVGIRALPLAEGTGYQMDATLLAGARFDWNAGEFLDSRGLSADKLGVYGWVQQGEDIVVLPVLVRDESTTGQSSDASRILKVRYPYLLAKLGWKVGRLDDAGDCVSQDSYTWVRYAAGRKPIDIPLPADSTGDCLLFNLKQTDTGTSIPQVIHLMLGKSKHGPTK